MQIRNQQDVDLLIQTFIKIREEISVLEAYKEGLPSIMLVNSETGDKMLLPEAIAILANRFLRLSIPIQ